MEGRLYTAEEIAQLLRVSKQFIYNLSNMRLPAHRRLPSIKIGRLLRFQYNDVLSYFENQGSHTKH